MRLSGLAPVVRDAYQVFGADSTSGGSYIVHPAPGETREVFIFYHYSS